MIAETTLLLEELLEMQSFYDNIHETEGCQKTQATLFHQDQAKGEVLYMNKKLQQKPTIYSPMIIILQYKGKKCSTYTFCQN